MVSVGETVAAKAVYNPDLPIKWNAEQVWRVEPDRADDRRPNPDAVHVRPIGRYENREFSGREDRRHKTDSDRPHSRPAESRSRSPPFSRSHNSVHPKDPSVTTDAFRSILSAPVLSTQLSTVRDLRASDLAAMYKMISPPIYLYRLKCLWQDSFSITQPFQSTKDVRFHQVNKMAVRLVNVEDHDCPPDPSYAVGVILLGCPPPNDLFERCVGSTSDTKPRPFTKCINMLTISQEGLRAVGSDWIPDLDGPDPGKNPQTLINTAIRACKDMIGLDLSECTRWYRFLEFRYSRSEGQSWPSVDELFSKGERWGTACEEIDQSHFQSTSATSKHSTQQNADPKGDSKKTQTSDEDSDDQPPHRVVVYFMPDIWSIMPNKRCWEAIKAKYQDPNSYCTPKDTFISSKVSEPVPTGNVESKNSEIDTSTKNELQEGEKKSMDALEPSPFEDIDSIKKETEEEGGVADNDEKFGEWTELEDPRKLHHSKVDINSLKVSELREQLSARRLDASGLKNQLFNRLKAALQEEKEDEERKAEEERAAAAAEAEAAAAAAAEMAAKEATLIAVGKPEDADVGGAASNEKPEIKLPVLPEQPSLIVQLKQNSSFSLVVCSLETIITLSKGHFKPCSQVYELFVCANHILHMFHRDAAFTLYKALVVLSDRKQLRSAQNASKPTSSKIESEQRPAKKSRLSSCERTSESSQTTHKASFGSNGASRSHESQPKTKVVDFPLLFACKLLDVSSRGYFSLFKLETIISSINLPISRYQIRALCANVINENRRLYYRGLTDVPDVSSAGVSINTIAKSDAKDSGGRTSASTSRASTKRPFEPTHDQLFTDLNGAPLSNIDDEEYLQELVRGGDAILEDGDEDEDYHRNVSAGVIVYGGTTVLPSESAGAHVAASETFLKQLRRVETQVLRLQQTVKTQNATLAALRQENSAIPRLQQKLKRANATADYYHNRCRDRRSTLSSTLQQLEAQACILESTSNTLRSVARRVKRDLSVGESSKSSPSSLASRRTSSRTPSVAPQSTTNSYRPKRDPPPRPEGLTGSKADLKTPDDVLDASTFIPPESTIELEEASTKVEAGQPGGLEEMAHSSTEESGVGPTLNNEFDVNSEGSLESAPE